MEDIRRVFFHELGHFIAHEINQLHYHGSGTASITIEPFELDKRLFIGDTKINLLEGQKEGDLPKEAFIPEYLAGYAYGCIFQSYYLETDLSHCFSINGEDDKNKWYATLGVGTLIGSDLDFEQAQQDYFTFIKKTGELDAIMKLDPRKYLTDLGDNTYSAKMDELRNDTAAFVEKHKDIYKQLIEKYEEIIVQSRA